MSRLRSAPIVSIRATPFPAPSPALQAHLPVDRLQQWVTLFMLTGAESLAVTALGFPVSWLAMRVARVGLQLRRFVRCHPVGMLPLLQGSSLL